MKMRVKSSICLLFLLFANSVIGAENPKTGLPPFGSFSTSGLDSINRQNLNININIPIVSLPGRGSSFSHSIVYDSLIWKKGTVGSQASWVPVSQSNYDNWGWKVDKVNGIIAHDQTTELCGVNTYLTTHNYSYTDPNGTYHEFAPAYTMLPKRPLTVCDPILDPGCDCDESLSMNRYTPIHTQ